MGIFNLKDNAFFLKNWREQTRPAILIPSVSILVLLVVMLFLFVKSTVSRVEDIYSGTAAAIFIMQGIIMLFIGIAAASKSTNQERIYGTIDFHRISPSSRLSQTIGLVFGTTVAVWILMLMTFPVGIYFAIAAGINIAAISLFYISMLMCAILYHSVGVLTGLSYDMKASNRAPSLFIIFILPIFLLIPLLDEGMVSSTVYYLSWIPGYDILFRAIDNNASVHCAACSSGGYAHLPLHTFYGYTLHPIIYQVIVQVPMIALVFAGIRRKINRPEGSMFTKIHTLLFVLFFLILISGSLVSSRLQLKKYDYTIFLGVAYFICILGAISATPDRLSFARGWRRARKTGETRMGLNDDHNSNSASVFLFLFAMLAPYILITLFFPQSDKYNILYITTIACSFMAFAGFLEAFMLSRLNKRRNIFWSAVFALWCLFPFLGMIISGLLNKSSSIPYLFFSLSPFSIIAVFHDLIGGRKGTGVDDISLFLLVGMNIVLAAAAVIFARVARAKVKKEIME
ncbi:MAG: hypothetical protein WC481_05110 [Candidatus Omnitrophota bacterium]